MRFKILALLVLSFGYSSCREARTIPPMKVGTFYDITFAVKPEGFVQNAFRVRAVGTGSWVQVETYDNPGLLLSPMMLGIASQSGSSPQELERDKKTALQKLKAGTRLKWINLQAATMVSETDPKGLGFLKDL